MSAKEGLGHKLREAESNAQALAETVEELRLMLDRQRASAELRYKTQAFLMYRTRRAVQGHHNSLRGAIQGQYKCTKVQYRSITMVSTKVPIQRLC